MNTSAIACVKVDSEKRGSMTIEWVGQSGMESLDHGRHHSDRRGHKQKSRSASGTLTLNGMIRVENLRLDFVRNRKSIFDASACSFSCWSLLLTNPLSELFQFTLLS
jgi:hypothetical protein